MAENSGRARRRNRSRPRRAVGAALPLRVRRARRAEDDGDDGRRALRQPYPDDDRRGGPKELARFYQHHFVNSNPKDTKIVPVSRTIGADQLVDEVLFCFTHDVEIDWMLPGIKPTGKYVEVPLVAIIRFRDGKLCHEHIYWDQASVLAQIGLLDDDEIANRRPRPGDGSCSTRRFRRIR